MSTRRDRAAGAIVRGMNAEFDLGFGVDELAQIYRVTDFVLAEVDRIPDVSELISKTDGGAAAPPADGTGGASPAAAVRATSTVAPPSLTDDGAVAPSEPTPPLAEAVSPGPVVLPRPFLLFRTRDVTGQSGTGVVAWGTEWPDRTVALRWCTANPSSVHWDNLEALLAVHGHGGATVVRWLEVAA